MTEAPALAVTLEPPAEEGRWRSICHAPMTEPENRPMFCWLDAYLDQVMKYLIYSQLRNVSC
jgi:hypothetical protein